MNKTIQAKLDRIFSEYIRLRDSGSNGYGRCISCGKVVFWKDADCGHFINRKHLSLRWNEVNCNLQCRACNRFDEGNIPAYGLALQGKYGMNIINQLLAIKNISVKHSDAEGLAMVTHYKSKVKEMKKVKGL